jgi:hypothetical protein
LRSGPPPADGRRAANVRRGRSRLERVGEPNDWSARRARIADGLVVADERDRFWCAADLRFEEIDYGRRGAAARARSPLPQDAPALVLGHERQLVDSPGWVGDRGLEQHAELPRHALDRAALEERHRIAEHRRELIAAPRYGEGEVEFRRTWLNAVYEQSVDAAGVDAKSGQLQRGAGHRLVGQQHLEQRRACQVAARRELLDQPLERHVLMGVGFEAAALHGGEQLGEARARVDPYAHGQGIDEPRSAAALALRYPGGP